MADKDDPAWAARQMRNLDPEERECRIVYGVLAGKVIDARRRFWAGGGYRAEGL